MLSKSVLANQQADIWVTLITLIILANFIKTFQWKRNETQGRFQHGNSVFLQPIEL